MICCAFFYEPNPWFGHGSALLLVLTNYSLQSFAPVRVFTKRKIPAAPSWSQPCIKKTIF